MNQSQRFRNTLVPIGKTYQQVMDEIPKRVTEKAVKEGLKGILQPFDSFYEGHDRGTP
jgi:hypothetical protein